MSDKPRGMENMCRLDVSDEARYETLIGEIAD
jgi:hypothetical protein